MRNLSDPPFSLSSFLLSSSSSKKNKIINSHPTFFPRRQGSNPLKMGVPKRVPSLNSQVEARCREMGGDRAIHSVLVANNGLAAVKFIRSVRSWAYKTFGNERAVAIVAMATPEDMRIDAEHIRMADQFVEVRSWFVMMEKRKRKRREEERREKKERVFFLFFFFSSFFFPSPRIGRGRGSSGP